MIYINVPVTTLILATWDKRLVPNDCFKHHIPEHQHGNHAQMPSKKYETLDVTLEKHIQKGKLELNFSEYICQ